MKTLFKLTLAAIILIAGLLTACEKTSDPTPLDPPPGAGGGPGSGGSGGATPVNSIEELYSIMEIKSQTYQLSAANGGTFTTAKGCKVTVPASAFIFQSGSPVSSGNVNIEFKDLLKKSDIMFSGIHTVSTSGLLVSAGEFFIRAKQGTEFLHLAKDVAIRVEIPALKELDPDMEPFVPADSAGQGAWLPDPSSELHTTTGKYLYDMYQFRSPASKGTWCNVDNSEYFKAYERVPVNVIPDPAQKDFSFDVFVIFSGINSMVHLYSNGQTFPFPFAPNGLQCTIVAFAVKDLKLYSCFIPVTISKNLQVNVSLSETTTKEFKQKIDALNN